MADELDRDEEKGPAPQWPYSAAPSAELETIRREHIKAETNIKGLATFIVFAGAVHLIGLASAGFVAVEYGMDDLAASLVSLERFAGLAVAVMYLYAGIKLRRLHVRGQQVFTAAYVISFVMQLVRAGSLLGATDVPAGYGVGWLLGSLAFGAFFLSIVWSKKARVVFTEHYQQVVIPATSHVKYSSKLLWILVVTLGVLLGILGAIAFVSASH